MRAPRCEKKQEGRCALTRQPRSARRAGRREWRERCGPRRRRRSCAQQLFRPSVAAGAAAASEAPRRPRKPAAPAPRPSSLKNRGGRLPRCKLLKGFRCSERSDSTVLDVAVFRGIEPTISAEPFFAIPERQKALRKALLPPLRKSGSGSRRTPPYSAIYPHSLRDFVRSTQCRFFGSVRVTLGRFVHYLQASPTRSICIRRS